MYTCTQICTHRMINQVFRDESHRILLWIYPGTQKFYSPQDQQTRRRFSLPIFMNPPLNPPTPPQNISHWKELLEKRTLKNITLYATTSYVPKASMGTWGSFTRRNFVWDVWRHFTPNRHKPYLKQQKPSMWPRIISVQLIRRS